MKEGYYKDTMQITDIHAHVFPDKLADRAAHSIGDFYSTPMYCAASVDRLLQEDGQAGISRCVISSSAVTPHQTRGINRFIAAAAASHPSFIGFGSIYPGMDGFEEELDRLQELGLRGLKIHPEFQKLPIDDPSGIETYRSIARRGLPVLFHMGDSRYDFSNPNRLIPLLRRFPRLTVIGAHFGGYTIWQEAARQLAGRFENLWVDCSSSFFAMDAAAGRALIDAYGADRVLFGTDYPMWDPQHELARLRGMHLAPETERKILYDNAAALFGLEGEN